MTENEKLMLLAYLLNEGIRLEDDVIDRRNACLRHETYEPYYFELTIALIRQKAFRKFSEDIMQLLGLRGDTPDKGKTED